MRGVPPSSHELGRPRGGIREDQPARESGQVKVTAGSGKGQRPALPSVRATDPKRAPGARP
jgi:hypothetical protein